MKHRYASDCHTHSFCSDGRQAPEEMLSKAIELGLFAYTLTDHCECNDYQNNYRARARQAWEAMESLKAPASLRFLRGVELGQPLQNLAGAQEAAERFDYDFIIGSLHNLSGQEDFYYIKYTDMPMEQIHGLLQEYWQDILEMIAWGGFDSLGHLTYPLRYIQGDQEIPVDMSRHQEMVDEIFRALIRAEKALELNTAGLWQKIGQTSPNLPLLKRYRELGGELVTLGSDAHCTDNLGRGIDEGMELLKEAGFREFAVYEKRRPVLLPLE